MIYRICHELTVEIKKKNERVLKNVIKRAFGELNNIFQDEFNKILFKQTTNGRLADSFYHITKSSELKLQNKGPKHTHVGQPCFEIFA